MTSGGSWAEARPQVLLDGVPRNLPAYADYKEIIEPHLAALKARSLKEWRAARADFAKLDLYYLLRYELTTAHIRRGGVRIFEHPFLFERCRDVQLDPAVELWARGHFKTTINFGLITQLVIRDPNTAILMVSHKKAIVSQLAARIGAEWEKNPNLWEMFPHVFWENAQANAATWSASVGWTVQRTSNRPEATLSVTTMGQVRAGMHYRWIIMDDPMTEDYVRSEAIRAMVDEKWPLHLACRDDNLQVRYIGTYYGPRDKWHGLRESDPSLKFRVIPAVIPNSPLIPGYEYLGGTPALLAPEELAQIYKDLDAETYTIQYLLQPEGCRQTSWKQSQFKRYDRTPYEESWGKNLYILCDPAGSPEGIGDETGLVVWGLGGDGNFYLLDGVVKQMSPGERNEWIFAAHRRWSSAPNCRVIELRIEEMGGASEAFHLRQEQERRGYRFPVVAIKRGGYQSGAKTKRLFEAFDAHVRSDGRGQIYLPTPGRIVFKGTRGRNVDLAEHFLHDCLLRFPLPMEDHTMDATAMLWVPERESDDPNYRIKALQWPVSDDQRPGRYSTGFGDGVAFLQQITHGSRHENAW